MKYDVVAIGELLIDLMQTDKETVYEAKAGGAPCNVLAMLQKLGYRTALIGKVGEDAFGRMLAEKLQTLGIGTEGLGYDRKVPTTLALVHHRDGGEREFSFYRNPGADLMLTLEEVHREMIRSCRIFHFGTLSMAGEPAAQATREAVELAEQEGKLISFDPNIRRMLWDTEAQAADAAWYGIEKCHILKISEDELEWLTGEADPDQGVSVLRARAELPLLCVTLGKKGSICYYGQEKMVIPAVFCGETVDTTGAGDTFCGCVLGSVLEYGLRELSAEQRKEMMMRAGLAAAIVTTRRGALESMPERKELESYRI